MLDSMLFSLAVAAGLGAAQPVAGPRRAIPRPSIVVLWGTWCVSCRAELAQWGPNGNGTLVHEDDARWVFFHDAKITADNARGVYVADFSPSLRKMDGVEFSVSGYMLPVEPSTTSAHFVLTRRSAGCPFCPPNEPTEAIEIFAAEPFAYTQSPVTVEGRLHLIAQSSAGLFYRIDNARVG